MSKKVAEVCKFQFSAGGTRPGPVLTSAGINMPRFCMTFNDATKECASDVVPAIIIAYEDKNFNLVIKTTPAAMMIRKAAGIKKASGNQEEISGKITVDQLYEIAKRKMLDLGANDVEATMCIVAGTAKDMGVEVEGFE